MNLKRKYQYSIIICFIIMTLTSCISRGNIIKEQQEQNGLLPTVRYKVNVKSSYGQMAAVYNNFLYYHAEKDNIKGIYQLNLETKYEKLVIEVDSIRKLQITEEGIYYIGRTKEKDVGKKDATGKWNTYQFFFHKGYQKTEIPDTLVHGNLYAWDFYIGENIIYFVTIANAVPIGRADLHKHLFGVTGDYISWKNCKNIMSNIGGDKALSIYEELVFLSRFELNDDDYEVTSIGAVYDKSIKEPIYILSDRVGTENAENYVLLGEYQNKYICIDKENMYLLDESGIYIHNIIEDIDWIKFGFIEDEELHVITETEEQERIYHVNLETFEVDLLLEIGKKEKVVAMIDGVFICVNNEAMIIRDAERGDIITEKKWENKINLAKDTIEIAGEYIFVYTSDQEIVLKEMQKIK